MTLPEETYHINCGKKLPDGERKNLESYTERLGNCRIELLDSSHFMYIAKPDESSKIIQDFINSISGS